MHVRAGRRLVARKPKESVSGEITGAQERHLRAPEEEGVFSRPMRDPGHRRRCGVFASVPGMRARCGTWSAKAQWTLCVAGLRLLCALLVAGACLLMG